MTASDPAKRIALLIDADNAPAAKIDVILAEVARHGEANVRRAYGNWKNPHIKGWEEKLHAHAIQPIQQFAYSTGKNASDMAMVIDGMDLLYARNLDGFAIVSSDADFTPLVMRLRSESLKVYGFGEKKTPEPFVKACSTFLYLENLGEPENPDAVPAAKPMTAAALRGDTKLVQLLRSAVDAASGDDGWSHLGAVGSQIGNQTSFDSRNYGYRKLSDLIEATDLFDVRRENLTIHVRDKPKAKKAVGRKRAAAGR
ncbi:MAG: NYN domain-containing protein [Lysobacter sp.]